VSGKPAAVGGHLKKKSLSGKKILVTGASGFIGSHLCRRLLALNAEVVGVSRKVQQNDETCTYCMEADLKENASVEKVIQSVKPHIIFHLASHVVGARHVNLVIPTFHDNLVSTVNILMESNQIGCEKIILIGSLEEPEKSDNFITPSSPYAAAKHAASAYGRMFHALFNSPVTIARLFMVYGPGQRDLSKLVPYTILSLLKDRVPKLTSGHRLVDWVYVDDVVDGLLAMASAQNIEGLTLDLGSGVSASIQEIVLRLVSAMGSRIKPRFGSIPDRPMEQVRLANVADTNSKINWKPKTSLERGLEKTVEWYRLNH
jgi:nucleoside-diphosphate-sugar epimerase